MDHLIFTAVSGASHSMMEQQIRANNLANANTEGFRADLDQSQSQAVQGDGYSSRFLVQQQDGGIDMTPGVIVQTGRPLDVAIKGQGLIALQSPQGEVYTRSGNMEQDANGALTIGGLPVLGDSGPIVLPPNALASVGTDGTISVLPDDGDVAATMEVDRIKLVNVPVNQLSKNPSGQIVTRNGLPAAVDENVALVDNSLESSNVSAVTEMVSTMSLNRQFEAQIKMMKAAEDLSDAGNRLLRDS
ncbi:flagellar basal body rod protein FlgF [Ewingella americana]|jgi:flagellar basal-body rod protein FlgF|uniref:flagellar basal body rod protein FlgF n=1 Tax=Ewingella americana TaxID=41202 RepID=UPI0012AD256C|nr:flagellar basal body rod protein FlgF [Ewingella americana]MRT04166.1 flagellar hook-basal body complex protein [Ewingella americana]